MEKLGQTLIVAAIVLALVMGLAIYAYNTMSPEARAISEALLPDYIGARRAVVWGVAIGIILAFVGFGGRIVAWALDHLAVALDHLIEAFVIRQGAGVPPQIVAIGKHVTPAESPGNVRELAAIFDGKLARAGGTGAAIREVRKPENFLPTPEPEPLQLMPPPAYASVYSAALPHQLALPLGESADGQVSVPLRNMGSIIIGGLQGKGKSECVASMIVNLLRQDPRGENVRLAVADLKGGLDFGHIPSDLDMMEYPVARTPDDVMGLTEQVWTETQRRQRILFAAKDAHIDAYNKRHPEHIPFLIFIIDELMMMSMSATDKGAPQAEKQRSERFNSALIKIGAEGRATGVSVIAATQKPSAEVVPTLFRDLCGLGIAFWCSRNHQSIAILGEPGAEDLPNQPGIALVRMGDGQLTRVRTYHAGIEEGRFLSFVERQPRSDRLALPFEADGDNDGIPAVPAMAYATQAPRYPGITYTNGDVTLTDYDEDLHRRVWEFYQTRGHSIASAMREVRPPGYTDGSVGGTAFYLYREIKRRGNFNQLPWQNRNGAHG